MMRCNYASNRQQQTDGRTNRQVNKIGDVGIKTKVNDHSTYSWLINIYKSSFYLIKLYIV